jgi:UDP-N-acetylmuramoylalanine--D-glutamate ligase
MSPDPRISEPALQSAWQKREIAVIGLARSGRSVATLLARSGNSVYASDSATSAALRETATLLESEGVAVDLGGHDIERVLGASLVVVSPGVPPDAPVIVAALRKNIDVVSEVEIALRFLPKLRYVAVTGTNGKTTTTALAAHLFQALGLRAVAAGNIGTPLSEIALEPAPPQWVALEISSYQLHFTPGIRPRVGALTNLSPNHLDRYTSVEEYYGDKRLLFRNAEPGSNWVINADDDAVRDLARDAAGLHATFSTTGHADAHYDRTTAHLMAFGEPLLLRGELGLLGDHNVANALCAALLVMVADPEHRSRESYREIANGLRTFRSLEHRIEVVHERDGVMWINDSKSTNVTSTLVAVRGMTRPTILLLGGKHKGEPYTGLAPELRRTVKRVIAYGEAAQTIARDLDGIVPVEQGGTSFAEVVDRAKRAASPGDAVLLSPACSSFDMFENYEKRGAEFKRLVTQP